MRVVRISTFVEQPFGDSNFVVTRYSCCQPEDTIYFVQQAWFLPSLHTRHFKGIMVSCQDNTLTFYKQDTRYSFLRTEQIGSISSDSTECKTGLPSLYSDTVGSFRDLAYSLNNTTLTIFWIQNVQNKIRTYFTQQNHKVATVFFDSTLKIQVCDIQNSSCSKRTFEYAIQGPYFIGPQLADNYFLHAYTQLEERHFFGLYEISTGSHLGIRANYQIAPDFSIQVSSHVIKTRIALKVSSSRWAFSGSYYTLNPDTSFLKPYLEILDTSTVGNILHLSQDLIVFEKAIYSTYYDKGLYFPQLTILSAYRNGHFYFVNHSSGSLVLSLKTLASGKTNRQFNFGSIGNAKVFSLRDLVVGGNFFEVFYDSFADTLQETNCSCQVVSE